MSKNSGGETRDAAATLKGINDGEHHYRTFSHRLRELSNIKAARTSKPAR